MDVNQFKQRWIVASSQKESAAAQSHFLELCALLNVPTPTEADPTGETYTFEKGATKAGGGDGYADVWYRGHFAIEYKGHKKDLNKAYQQVIKYKDALENPPLLVVCDLNTIRIHTNFTNTRQQTYEITLADLDGHNAERGVSNLVLLAKMWTEPEWFRPTETADSVTIEAARRFSEIARGLHQRGTDPEDAAHFLVQMVFCLFAEDIRLLPENIFSKMIGYTYEYPARFQEQCTEFLQKMNTGGDIAYQRIPYVNGGLFESVDVPELTKAEIGKILDATEWDWSTIEPAIFGTLFERSLDPEKRSQLGAHYTSKADIQRVVDPVVIQPLRRRFADVVQKHGAPPPMSEPALKLTARQKKSAQADIDALLDELANATVLDPACGSGNFLYVALEELLTLELEVQHYESKLFRQGVRLEIKVSPMQLRGIEINPYAQQLAQTSIWIGYLQWLQRNIHNRIERSPILDPLDSIELKDALLTFHDDGSVTETEWPAAKYIIGNPPFLGSQFLRRELGDDYVEILFKLFGTKISNGVDLVCYFFEKARYQIERRESNRAGLLATQGIRGGANREVLRRIKSTGDIYLAWSDEPWTLEGAAVRISIVGFDDGTENDRMLDGQPVDTINPNLSAGQDLSPVVTLNENRDLAYKGNEKGGKFDISSTLAGELLAQPLNPNGHPNSDVVVPWFNGGHLAGRWPGTHIIDFGPNMAESDAALYEEPYRIVRETVKESRQSNRVQRLADQWWIHRRPIAPWRNAASQLSRYIATSRVAKHRVFIWLPKESIPDSTIVAIAREDDYFLGVLQSRSHVMWSHRMGTALGPTPRYTSTTTFETYPFPWPPGQEPVDDPRVQAIGEAAKALDDARNSWLNPADASDAELKKRTLTNLYNANPTWLQNLHASLDRAVWSAYGWPHEETPAEVEEDVILGRLLALNLERAEKL